MTQGKNTVTRVAAEQDSPGIVDLWRRFMLEEREAVPVPDLAGTVRNWSERLDAQIARTQVVVAVHDGRAVGFAGFIDAVDRAWVPDGVAYVVDFYVVPEARRTGAAQQLFQCLLVRLEGRYTETWSNTSARNRRVQILLRRVGFRPLQGFCIAGLENQVYYCKGLGAQEPGRGD